MTELITIFNQNPWLFIAISFVFAAIIGSFLNVVVHRLPVMMKRDWQQECNHYLAQYKPSIFSKHRTTLNAAIDEFPAQYNLLLPGSACPKCKAKINPVHNLPLVGWLIVRGKCAACQHSISARYPLVELITASSVAFLAWHFGPSLAFVFATILTFALIVLTGIDLDEMLLPDQITLPLLWLGLLLNLSGTFTSLPDALIGAAAGYLSLWSVFWAFKLLTGKEGMGYGDFKLLAVFGAWFGWQVLPLVILLSSLVGAIVGLTLMALKRLDHNNPIPFGPYIAAAGWIAMIWGESITQWYLLSL